ncbi:MAG: hypothetical protein Ta2C_11080 [Candidatus Endomicrobiellum trichonymphae]|uniref:HU family DNA-binding protein n=1 Tax=Endomicrobium trichonymphae TaxID=1408204 RepID=UPI0027D3567F|nr:MAG: hypothetical protein Ta2C_11080 [Candidatus Endomicrobium trichonymphae]
MSTLTVKDLVNHIRSVSNLTIYDSNKLANIVLKFFVDTLANGNAIKLRGLGTFDIKTIKARKNINPTGEEILLPKRKKIIFKPAKSLNISVQKTKKKGTNAVTLQR